MRKLVIRGKRTVYEDLTPEEEAARLLEIEQNTPTPEQLAKEAAIADAPLSARAWFQANPNAKLIFSMSVAEIVAEIANLVDVLFPGATAGNRTKLKLLLTSITLVVRIWVKREALD